MNLGVCQPYKKQVKDFKDPLLERNSLKMEYSNNLLQVYNLQINVYKRKHPEDK